MPANITEWLESSRAGNAEARERLIRTLYPELREMAARLFRKERHNHTLQPTALVNEAWLRLAGGTPIAIENRSMLFGVAARLMREILIDHARHRARAKRDGGERITLSALNDLAMESEIDLIDLNSALDQLESIDPAKARIVELRYFGGLSIEDVALAMAISPATVKRHWQAARVWLLDALAGTTVASASEP